MTTLPQTRVPVNPGCEDASMRAVLYCLDANALTPEELAVLLVAATRWDRAAERRLVALEGGLVLYHRYLRVMGLTWDHECDTLSPRPAA